MEPPSRYRHRDLDEPRHLHSSGVPLALTVTLTIAVRRKPLAVSATLAPMSLLSVMRLVPKFGGGIVASGGPFEQLEVEIPRPIVKLP